MSLFPRQFNKMFLVELKNTIAYPTKEDRWTKYGEPLTGIFSRDFSGQKLIQWFTGNSGTELAGANIFCFESTSKWKEEQDSQRTLELCLKLTSPISNLFERFGTSAMVTGAKDFKYSLEELTIELVKAKSEGSSNLKFGQLPVESDIPDENKPQCLIKNNGRYYIGFIGTISQMNRIREINEEQFVAISNAN